MSRKEEDAAVVEAAVPAAVEAAVPAAVPAASLAPGWFPSPVHFKYNTPTYSYCETTLSESKLLLASPPGRGRR